jgi:type I restriction enzyme S subunit
MSNTSIDAGIFPRGFSTHTNFAWPLVPAGSVVDLVYGDALTEKYRRMGPVPVYGTNGRCGWHDTPLTQGPGVILGRKGMGPLGVEWCESDYWVIDTAYYVRPLTNDIDLKYFYYLVKYIGLNHLKDGTSNPSLTRDTFKRLLLPMPPRKEQTKIHQMLSLFDGKIEHNRQMNETLEAMARALFKSWFIDFDPVHAKTAVRRQHSNWSNAQVSRFALPNLASEIAELFPDHFEDSSFGSIPAGWGTRPLYDIAKFVNGAAFKNEDFCDCSDGLPVLKIAELKDGITAQTKYSLKDVSANQRIACGDLLYSWSGSPDTSLDVFRWAGPKGLLNQHIFNVITRNQSDRIFAYYLLKHLRSTLVEIARNKQTTGLGHVTVADMQRIFVPSIPAPLLDQFAVSAGSLFTYSFNLEVESMTLSNTRDNLLPKLLSGTVAV